MIGHIIYRDGQSVGFTLETDLTRAQIYAEVAYPGGWVTIAAIDLYYSDALARRPTRYAVESASGAHVGLWKRREDAIRIMRDYPGSTLLTLVEVQ